MQDSGTATGLTGLLATPERTMPRQNLLAAGLVAALLAGSALAQPIDTSVADTIAARRGLMTQLTTLQALVDARVASGDHSADLSGLAQATAASLDAFALLLAPDTNLLGGAPAVEGAQTTAAATIWEDLPAFRQLVRDVATKARLASEAADLADFQARWAQVAEACTSCHEQYVFFDPFAALN